MVTRREFDQQNNSMPAVVCSQLSTPAVLIKVFPGADIGFSKGVGGVGGKFGKTSTHMLYKSASLLSLLDMSFFTRKV